MVVLSHAILADAIRRRSRRSESRSDARWRTAPDHRRFARGQFRSGRSAVLETADLRAGSNESRSALAARIGPPARRGATIEQARAKMNALRASLAPVIYQKGLGLHGGPVREDAGWRYAAPLDLSGVRSGCDGVAHRLRECREPGAGQGSDPAEGDGPQSQPGGRPRPFDRAVAHREPGPVSCSEAWRVLRWPTCCFMPRLPWWRHRCRLPPISAWISRVLGFAAVAVMAVLILTGLLPSLQTSFGKLSSSLNQAARGSSGSSAAVRRAIVIGEVAVSVVLICGAALLFKSLAKLQQVDAGVRIDHVITMSTDLPSAAYPTAGKRRSIL